MLRRSFIAALLMLLVVGVSLSGEYTGFITNFDFSKGQADYDSAGTHKFTTKAKKGKKGEEITFALSKDLKIFKAGRGRNQEPAAMSANDFIKILEEAKESKVGKGPKGVFAKIETIGEGDKEVITKITTMTRGNKNK